RRRRAIEAGPFEPPGRNDLDLQEPPATAMRNRSFPTRCEPRLRFFGGARVSGGIALVAVLATAPTSLAQQTPAPSPANVESSEAKARFATAQELFKAKQFAEALPI